MSLEESDSAHDTGDEGEARDHLVGTGSDDRAGDSGASSSGGGNDRGGSITRRVVGRGGSVLVGVGLVSVGLLLALLGHGLVLVVVDRRGLVLGLVLGLVFVVDDRGRLRHILGLVLVVNDRRGLGDVFRLVLVVDDASSQQLAQWYISKLGW